MLALFLLTKEKEAPAMPSACLLPEGAHRGCPDEKQVVTAETKPQLRGSWICRCHLKEADGCPQQRGQLADSLIKLHLLYLFSKLIVSPGKKNFFSVSVRSVSTLKR